MPVPVAKPSVDPECVVVPIQAGRELVAKHLSHAEVLRWRDWREI